MAPGNSSSKDNLLLISDVHDVFSQCSFVKFRHRSCHLFAREIISFKATRGSVEMASGVVPRANCIRRVLAEFKRAFFSDGHERMRRNYRNEISRARDAKIARQESRKRP